MNATKWENLQRIFVDFRFNIRNSNYYQIADIIIKVINNNISNEEMCKMIFEIIPEYKNKLILNDVEKKELFIKREVELFIIRAVEIMKDNIFVHEYEMAYDIADMLQGLYGFIISNQRKGLKLYWKIYIKPLQKKWNCNMFNEYKSIFR